jgi:Flp pilus assembly protein CpaB
VVDIAQNMFSTRRGSIVMGAAASVLAGIVLFAYLHNYRSSVKSAVVPTSVLVAKNLIQKGTPGDIIGTTNQFQVAQLPKSQLQPGALVDPAALTGRVAVADIFPGQQLTATDFVLAPLGSIQQKIAGYDRAISIAIDSSHGMIGQISSGDHIDVLEGFNLQGAGGTQPVIKLVMTNVLVLRAPFSGGSGIITLRAPVRQAAQLAYAADNGRLWFVLRPANGAKDVNPGIVNAQTLLNVKPVR